MADVQADIVTVRAKAPFHSGEPGCFGPHHDCTPCAALRLADEVERQAAALARVEALCEHAETARFLHDEGPNEYTPAVRVADIRAAVRGRVEGDTTTKEGQAHGN